MAKELYLYSGIYSYTAEAIVSQLEASSREDITLRINTGGGSVFAGWGIVAKMKEKKHGKINIKVDGAAMSMGIMPLLYADHVSAIPTAMFMIHRAIGPTNTPEDKKLLDDVNAGLHERLAKRLKSNVLKTISGVNVDDIFGLAERKDIYLTAAQALEVGLIDEITDLTPREIEAIEAHSKAFSIAAESIPNPSNTPTMLTLEQLQAQNPALVAQIIALGVAKENARVKAWARYASVDPEAVRKGIDGTAEITMDQALEFMEKKMNGKKLGDLKAETEDNKGATGTGAEADQEKVKAEAAKKEKEEFLNNVNAFTGVKIF